MGTSSNGSSALSKRKKGEKSKRNNRRCSIGELLVLPFLSKFPMPSEANATQSEVLDKWGSKIHLLDYIWIILLKTALLFLQICMPLIFLCYLLIYSGVLVVGGNYLILQAYQYQLTAIDVMRKSPSFSRHKVYVIPYCHRVWFKITTFILKKSNKGKMRHNISKRKRRSTT